MDLQHLFIRATKDPNYLAKKAACDCSKVSRVVPVQAVPVGTVNLAPAQQEGKPISRSNTRRMLSGQTNHCNCERKETENNRYPREIFNNVVVC